MESIKDIINRLSFEELLWIIFIGNSIINIYGDELEKDYVKNNRVDSKKLANKAFELTIIVTFFIYIYFLIRNYNAYKKASLDTKKVYEIKLLGSALLIAGVLCLLYFQEKEKSFIGTPAA